MARDDDEARELRAPARAAPLAAAARQAAAPERGARARAGAGADVRAALECPRGPLGRSPRGPARRSGGRASARVWRCSEHTPVSGLELDRAGTRVTGVVSGAGERVQAGEVVLAAGAWSRGWRSRRSRRAHPGPAREGPDHAPARPRRAGTADAHDPLRGRLPAPPRRRPLRARRHRRGAWLRAHPHRRRRVRAAARRPRAGAGGDRARARGGLGRAAPGDPRQRSR